MYYNYKKQRIKNCIGIIFILAVALFATHYIYYKFQNERDVDYSSASLDIVFHEKTGEKIELKKVTPVTDAVGLSSKSYTFTIKNNLTIGTKYKIKLVDDIETLTKDNCLNNQIPREIIKVSIKEEGKDNIIYLLNQLPENILLDEDIKPLEEKEYSVRVWTTSDAKQDNELHYHGKIQIVEDGNVAIAR